MSAELTFPAPSHCHWPLESKIIKGLKKMKERVDLNATSHVLHNTHTSKLFHRFFDVITSIVSFLWAYTTAARDVTGERVRTAYDVTAAYCHKRRTQRNVFCHTWY